MHKESIFLDFNLPNLTSWFYFSLFLAVGLFVRFSRFFSIRNCDVLSLFALVPGVLLIDQAKRHGPSELLWYGYLWLLCGSVYLFLRCLVDLTLVRRPAISPNLTTGGLIWLASALLVCLGFVASRGPSAPAGEVGKGSVAVEETQKRVEDLVNQTTEAGTDRTWVRQTLAMSGHVAVVLLLVLIGYRHFQDAHAGMAMATLYLLLPYTAYYIAQVHHVLPAALILAAVATYKRPVVSGSLLGVAAGTFYFPALVYPVWVSFYRRRGAGRFTVFFLLSGLLCLGVIGSILWSQGELKRALDSALALSDWQPWRKPTTEGFWNWIDGSGIRWAYRIPVFIAYVAFLGVIAIWPSPKNLSHVIALSAASLLGIQFWYADQGGVYVLWYLPLLMLIAYRPNLADRIPPAIAHETDWVVRLGRYCSAHFQRMLKPSEQPVRVGP